MGLLDGLLNVACWARMGGGAAGRRRRRNPMLQMVLQLMPAERRHRRRARQVPAGRPRATAHSWLRRGENVPIRGNALQEVLGQGALGEIAQQLGMSHGEPAADSRRRCPAHRSHDAGRHGSRQPRRPGVAGARDAAERSKARAATASALGLQSGPVTTRPSHRRPPWNQPTLITALVLGIVEGLTEFLPISSHRPPDRRRLAAGLHRRAGQDVRDRHPGRRDPRRVLGVPREAGRACCADCSATAAAQRFVVNLVVAFLPAAVLGLAFNKAIKAHLFAPVPVACAFVVGALVILWAERRQRLRPNTIRIATSTPCAGPTRSRSDARRRSR